jgi:hypothetical protein
MSVLARLILAFSLLIQSFPGLTIICCAGAGAGACPDDAAAEMRSANACRCCCSDDESAVADGPVAGKSASCRCCGLPQAPKPAPIPTTPKSDRLEQFLPFVSVVVGILPPEPASFGAPWRSLDRPTCRSSNSMQSILCVWMV